MEKFYNFLKIEKKWQKIWIEAQLSANGTQPDSRSSAIIFPPASPDIPTGVENGLIQLIPDIIMRRKKMQGFYSRNLPGLISTGFTFQKAQEKDSFPYFGAPGLVLNWRKLELDVNPQTQNEITGMFAGIFKKRNISAVDGPNEINLNDLATACGADALRLTLAVQAVRAVVIKLSINRIKGYRRFMNKIWNASRFTLEHIKEDENFDIDTKQITTVDRWMLHFLNTTVEKVNELMDHYQVDKAASLLYRFFRREYCGWYIEFCKKDIKTPNSVKVLKFVLLKLIQLLHPFIPFITEEIYHKITSGKDFLLQTEFPTFNSELIFYNEFLSIELLKKVIRGTRKIRTANNIDPNCRINIYLKTDSEKEKTVLSSKIEYYNRLTGSAGTEIVPGFDNLQKGYKGYCPNWEILLPFTDDEERLAELERLTAELKNIENRVVNFEKKLADREHESFLSPADLRNLKKDLQAAIDQKEKIKKIIADLS